MKKLIVVTGGAGFIGSALIWHLNNLGIYDILVVDHLGNSEKFKNLIPLKFYDYIEKEDFIFQLDQFNNYRFDTIFHLGACSSTTESDASYLIKNNFEYTKVLCEWALKNNIRFIYASSAATYGDGSNGFNDDHALIESLRPLNMYGYSKQLFDMYALNKGYLDKIVGLKYFNVFGPNEYHKGDMRSMVLKGFLQIKDTGKLCLFKSYKIEYKDGEQKRDFIYVHDAVKATLFFYRNRNINGIFNIGTGNTATWLELAYALFNALDLEPNIEFIDMPDNIRKKYQYYTCANINKLKEAGYIEEFTPIYNAIGDYVKNYLIPESYLGQ